jgi:S-layer protein
VDITDKSGLEVDGLTVATGSTLTTASVTGNTGLATLTGKGIVDVTMASSAGGLTVTNATAGHALALKVSGITAGTVRDDVATTISVASNATTTAATANVFTGLTAAKVTDVTVSGTKSLNLGTVTTPKLQNLTITGSGGVTANVASTGDTTTSGYVTKVDTTGSTAVLSAANGTIANAITIGVSTDFAGGAGSDNLTVGASTRALSLGAGTDKLVLTAALYGNSTIGGGTADGGDGTDTLETTFDIAVTAGSSSGVINDKISNFEKLSITAGTLTDVVTVDFDYLKWYIKNNFLTQK